MVISLVRAKTGSTPAPHQRDANVGRLHRVDHLFECGRVLQAGIAGGAAGSAGLDFGKTPKQEINPKCGTALCIRPCSQISEEETLPLLCVFPLPPQGEALPLSGVPAALVAEALPLPCVFHCLGG